MSVALSDWGDGVTRVALGTEQLRLGVLTRGATVQSLQLREGDRWVELVLGFDEAAPYLADEAFIGATVGRYANRIAGGTFTIDGVSHQVPANDGPHALHGGPDHFGRRTWSLSAYNDASVTLTLVSPDGDMGFPGRLEVTTVFRVDGRSVTQETTASTDAPTVVNLTNHAYFNLEGLTRGAPDRGQPTIDGHVLRVPAGCYLPVDATGIPLPGPPTCVAGTPYDLREARAIGDARFDHTFVLAGAAEVSAGGRTLTVTTTEPGVQVYTGDHLPHPRTGLCLETQHFPDSPNRDDYPSTLLRPGAPYHTSTRWELTPATGV